MATPIANVEEPKYDKSSTTVSADGRNDDLMHLLMTGCSSGESRSDSTSGATVDMSGWDMERQVKLIRALWKNQVEIPGDIGHISVRLLFRRIFGPYMIPNRQWLKNILIDYLFGSAFGLYAESDTWDFTIYNHAVPTGNPTGQEVVARVELETYSQGCTDTLPSELYDSDIASLVDLLFALANNNPDAFNDKIIRDLLYDRTRVDVRCWSDERRLILIEALWENQAISVYFMENGSPPSYDKEKAVEIMGLAYGCSIGYLFGRFIGVNICDSNWDLWDYNLRIPDNHPTGQDVYARIRSETKNGF